MASAVLSGRLCLALLALLSAPPRPQGQSAHALALAPENEVPLRPTAWLPEGRVTTVHLTQGHTRRLYFTLKKKSVMSVTVSPCDLAIEWTLAARTLKDKASKSSHWSSKKSTPEVWWRGPGTEAKIHTYTGNAMDTYEGPSHAPASIYILRLRPKEQSTKATVYLHEGSGPSGVFPVLPADPRVHILGVGMTSVTLSWAPSPAQTRLPPGTANQHGHSYCVLVNRQHNYRSLCAAQEGLRKEREKDEKREKKERKKKVTVWPILKDWWWQQWDAYQEPRSPAAIADGFGGLPCACRGTESVCTVSELLPDTRYYFDVFVTDGRSVAAATYTGTLASTHEEARTAVTPLREGELRWVTFRDGGSASAEFFRFWPRGGQRSGLLTLQGCGGGRKIRVTVSSEGRVLSSQEVGEDLVQIWLQGGPSYLIHLEREGPSAPVYQQAPAGPTGALRASVKMQTSSAYHRRGIPALPPTLQIKSFNKLRTCDSVTLAWMGTEERSLYCVYRRRLGAEEDAGGAVEAPCLGPESRSDTERVLCKYFQELNPRRAVTTAAIGDLEPGAAYVFDVYLMRRWGIAVKYVSKTIRTRKEC